MRSERWLTVAGFVTWLLSGLPTFTRIVDGRVDRVSTVVWVPALGFLILSITDQKSPNQQRITIQRSLITN